MIDAFTVELFDIVVNGDPCAAKSLCSHHNACRALFRLIESELGHIREQGLNLCASWNKSKVDVNGSLSTDNNKNVSMEHVQFPR